ncbi:hypothetical protein HUF18_16005 [Thalassolituus sp. ST750PaO-4]|uniref:hypothetical protein n=1 Tax=Thalassolituus sp. ST750PaO-4 TaxID=2742965 RepID=UPI001CE2D1C6|nr:hypothetical protein [Thalassolituus sp. ST750PaO-4]MCA6061285.1 hypothetical protein [Thalassolituus sp. ST750PaO-4]
MDIIEAILRQSSLWEITLLAVLIYLFIQPDFRKRITKIKLGNFELELQELKDQVQKGQEKIQELEEEVENERRFFEDFLEDFDPNTPISELAKVRQSIRSQAKNLTELESLKSLLNLQSSAEELYFTAVALREKRPVSLLPDLISFLQELSADKNLGGYRLNTIWTLTSALHLTLIACIRDKVGPMPDKEILEQAQRTLNALEQNPRVQQDRPDNPSKGIRGPLKHALTWVGKGLEANKKA